MGIHSGPVDLVEDVNDNQNLAGAGVNIAQRVMDCGDAGHILLSARAADDLAQYAEWNAQLHEIGEAEVKHGVRSGSSISTTTRWEMRDFLKSFGVSASLDAGACWSRQQWQQF